MEKAVQHENETLTEISLEEILAAANLLPSEGNEEERIATALRALDW